jgi:hypothetical protein
MMSTKISFGIKEETVSPYRKLICKCFLCLGIFSSRIFTSNINPIRKAEKIQKIIWITFLISNEGISPVMDWSQ